MGSLKLAVIFLLILSGCSPKKGNYFGAYSKLPLPELTIEIMSSVVSGVSGGSSLVSANIITSTTDAISFGPKSNSNVSSTLALYNCQLGSLAPVSCTSPVSVSQLVASSSTTGSLNKILT
ncbi:MAG: hypothetical protein SGI74_14320 [Oligoflexia bacterium]|nr:hypothetical protein [Oligoflexia bacterium]